MNNYEIILELEQLLILRQQDELIDLTKYQKIYLECKENYSKLCEKCIQWKTLGLPYDCIEKPFYCLKNESDWKIISLYEEINNYID